MKNWTLDTLSWIISTDLVNKTAVSTLEKLTDLLPPQFMPTLRMDNWFRGLKLTEYVPKRQVDEEAFALFTRGDLRDEIVQKAIPARNKSEYSLRRSRFNELYDTRIKIIWAEFCNLIKYTDYFTALNIGWFIYLHDEGLDIIKKYKEKNWLDSTDNFNDIARKVSDRSKKWQATIYYRQLFAEMSSCLGYRLLPVPGYDVLEEATKLSQGGGDRPYPNFKNMFLEEAKEIISEIKPYYQVKYMSFRDYIKSNIWVTSGSSSIGKIKVEFEGEKIRFKARKNWLPYLYSHDELYDECIKHKKTMVSTVFPKEELAKVRIAVAGDLFSYLIQSWLSYLTGSAYKNWKYGTMNETPIEQYARQSDSQSKLWGCYALPWDFSQFDHQINTWECKIIAKLYWLIGRANVPLEGLAEWDDIHSSAVESFDNSWMKVNVDGVEHMLKVLGGLPSGIFSTSLLGNNWNLIMTRLVIKIVKTIYPEFDPSVAIRGDDTDLNNEKYNSILLSRVVYAALNAIGNDSKYGIHWQVYEFLRNWITPNTINGLPNRSIPNLTQRKPWSNDPWTADQQIKNISLSAQILSRRTSRSFEDIFTPFARSWTRKRKLSNNWLKLPEFMGGLGCDEWKYKVPDVAYPTFKKQNIPLPYRETFTQEYIAEWKTRGFDVTKYAKEMILDELNGLATSDDIRGMAHIWRKSFDKTLDAFRQIKVTWRSAVFDPIPVNWMTKIGALSSVNHIRDFSVMIGPALEWIGGFKDYLSRWRDLTRISKYDKSVRPMKSLYSENPVLYHQVKRLESKGIHRTLALDLCFGDVPQPNVGFCSPLGQGFISLESKAIFSQYLALSKKQSRESWNANFYLLSKITLTAFSRSKLYIRTFNY